MGFYFGIMPRFCSPLDLASGSTESKEVLKDPWGDTEREKELAWRDFTDQFGNIFEYQKE